MVYGETKFFLLTIWQVVLTGLIIPFHPNNPLLRTLWCGGCNARYIHLRVQHIFHRIESNLQSTAACSCRRFLKASQTSLYTPLNISPAMAVCNEKSPFTYILICFRCSICRTDACLKCTGLQMLVPIC